MKPGTAEHMTQAAYSTFLTRSGWEAVNGSMSITLTDTEMQFVQAPDKCFICSGSTLTPAGVWVLYEYRERFTGLSCSNCYTILKTADPEQLAVLDVTRKLNGEPI